MPRWDPRPRQPFSGLALSAIGGIALAEYFPGPLWLAVAVAAILGFATLLARRTWVCCLFTAATFFALHDLRHFHSEARLLAQELGPAPTVATATGIVWSKPSEAKTVSRFTTGSFTLRLESLTVAGRTRPIEAHVLTRWNGPIPRYGDRVRILGSLQPLEPARNQGQFDFADWQHRRGIYSQLAARYAVDCEILSHGHGRWTQRLAIAAQRWVAEKLELDLEDSPEISALIASMVLGLQGDTPRDVKELFQLTGTMHLFAVSGLNVAMLATIAWYLLQPLRVSRRHAILIIVPLLAFYALLTGLSASCLRACIMGALVLSAHLFDRNPVPYNSVAAAAFCILAWDTNQFFSTGFRYSFVLVLALLWMAPRFTEWLKPLGDVDPFLPRLLWTRRQRLQSGAWWVTAQAIGVSIASWFGSVAFTAVNFHLISPTTVIANVVAVPLAFAILALGVAAVLVGTFSSTLAMLFNNANWLITKGLLISVKFFAGIPGAYFYYETPELERRVEWEIAVLDVGSGGAAFVRTPDAEWMFDCGHASDYDRIVKPFLRARGVNRLDGLLLTHGDAQHIGGAPALLENYRPASVVDSPMKDRSANRRQFQTALAADGTPKRIVQRGDTLLLGGGLRATILYPPAGLARSVADDKALVLRIEGGATRALFVSDIGFSTEQWLLENEPDLRADILIKGEHGKDLSGSPDFLRAVQPQLIVLTGPDRYRSRGPRDAWIEEVRAAGYPLFSQEATGEVRLKMRREGFVATGHVDGQTFRSRAR